jgi:4-hydroxy-4-methyl-2-oxoglutarate aldolase
MIEIDRPVVCAGVFVCTGDTVFGDVDGVVVIPQSICDQVFEKALDKATRENRTRDELRQGRLLSEVYAKYGVL